MTTDERLVRLERAVQTLAELLAAVCYEIMDEQAHEDDARLWHERHRQAFDLAREFDATQTEEADG